MSTPASVRLCVRSAEYRVTRGRHAKMTEEGDARSYVIGSSDEALLQCTAEGIDDLHCVVTVQQRSVTVRDLNSRTGVFVNGQRITETRLLRDADILRIGPLELMVEIDPAVEEDTVYQEPSTVEEDEQISEWLLRLDAWELDRRRNQPELRRFELPRPPSSESAETAATDENQDAEESAEPSPPTPAKKPARLPKPAAPQPEDSVNAAELALRKLGIRTHDVLRGTPPADR